jgi:hypothetical protein
LTGTGMAHSDITQPPAAQAAWQAMLTADDLDR